MQAIGTWHRPLPQTPVAADGQGQLLWLLPLFGARALSFTRFEARAHAQALTCSSQPASVRSHPQAIAAGGLRPSDLLPAGDGSVPRKHQHLGLQHLRAAASQHVLVRQPGALQRLYQEDFDRFSYRLLCVGSFDMEHTRALLRRETFWCSSQVCVQLP